MAIDVVVSKENSFLAGLGVQDPWHQIILLGGLTLVNADFIYVPEKGRFLQSSRHKELITQSGPYKALWSVQTGQSIKSSN